MFPVLPVAFAAQVILHTAQVCDGATSKFQQTSASGSLFGLQRSMFVKKTTDEALTSEDAPLDIGAVGMQRGFEVIRVKKTIAAPAYKSAAAAEYERPEGIDWLALDDDLSFAEGSLFGLQRSHSIVPNRNSP